MTFLILTFSLIAFSSVSYLVCRNRVLYKIKVTQTATKSLPKHYSQNLLIWSFVPAFVLLLLFTIGTPRLLDSLYSERIAEAHPHFSLAEIQLNLSKVKNIVAGDADVLLVPSVETGNALVKIMIYFMGACAAGVVIGGKVPVVITSRSDEASARLASIAAAVVALD